MAQTKRTFAESFDEALRVAEEYRERGSDRQLEVLAEHLESIAGDARESLQALYFDLYSEIASKLEKGKDLIPAERQAVQVLIAGAGEYYVRIENNVGDWKAELDRIIGELSKLRMQGIDTAAELMNVQALCTDANTVLPDLLRYSQERERMTRARESLSGPLTDEDGRFLARAIRDMLASEGR